MNNFHVKKYIINDCWWICYIDIDCVLVYVNVLTSMLMGCLVKKYLAFI
jgi:hypothetical protein